ncbi:MAG: hypothetical protein U0Z44_01135 [Kouleothrix sp.]
MIIANHEQLSRASASYGRLVFSGLSWTLQDGGGSAGQAEWCWEVDNCCAAAGSNARAGRQLLRRGCGWPACREYSGEPGRAVLAETDGARSTWPRSRVRICPRRAEARMGKPAVTADLAALTRRAGRARATAGHVRRPGGSRLQPRREPAAQPNMPRVGRSSR